MKPALATLAVAATMLVSIGSAKAEPVGVSVGVLGGYGSNDQGWGLGGRAGYTFKGLPIYVGAELVWQFGYKSSLVLPDGSLSADESHDWFAGAEGGWNFTWRIVTVRPKLGAGALQVHHRSTVGARALPEEVLTNPYVAPGVTAFVSLAGQHLQLGVDARAQVVMGSSIAAFVAGYGYVGAAF